MIENLPALTVLVPLLSAMLAPVAARLRSVREMRMLAVGALALTFLVCAAGLCTAVVYGPLRYHFGGWLPPWGIEFVLDPLSGMMAVLVSFFSLLSVFGLSEETEGWAPLRAGAFYALYLLLTAGLIGISVTGDMFNLYVFLEISALSGYALVAAGGDKAKVAAYRYLIIGSVAATFWVIGLGYLYGLTGTLNMADLARHQAAIVGSPAAVAAVAFIVTGLAIKMALFPVHGWQPDAYCYAPSSVMPFIAAAMPKVAAYALLRVLYWVFVGGGPVAPVAEVLKWTAAGSILFGSAMALRQNDLRRLLAYSSIAQIGYVALGIAIGTPLAIAGALLHMINHAVMKSCLFFTVGGFQSRSGKTTIEGLSGMGERMPWTAAAFTTAALSMIGLPPACGFFSKFYLVRAALSIDSWALVGVLAASSLLSAVYFFRCIETLYFKESENARPLAEPRPAILVPALILAVLVLAFGLFNHTLYANVIDFALPRAFDLAMPGGGT